MVSVSLSTLVDTVAPSLLFFPSLLDVAIFSVKSHNLPSGIIIPFSGLRRGIQSGDRVALGWILAFRDLATTMMPSSSKRFHAFFKVSLLTASK